MPRIPKSALLGICSHAPTQSQIPLGRGDAFPEPPLTFGINYCPLVIPTKARGLQSCLLSLSELIPGAQQKTGHRPKPEHILNWRKNFQLGWRGGIIVPGKPQAEVIHIHLISL